MSEAHATIFIPIPQNYPHCNNGSPVYIKLTGSWLQATYGWFRMLHKTKMSPYTSHLGALSTPCCLPWGYTAIFLFFNMQMSQALGLYYMMCEAIQDNI